MSEATIHLITEADVYPPDVIHIDLVDADVTVLIRCRHKADAKRLFEDMADGVVKGHISLEFEVN